MYMYRIMIILLNTFNIFTDRQTMSPVDISYFNLLMMKIINFKKVIICEMSLNVIHVV